jgi:hypothetical protein
MCVCSFEMQEVSNWSERAGKIKASEDSEEFCKFNNNKCQKQVAKKCVDEYINVRFVSCKFE